MSEKDKKNNFYYDAWKRIRGDWGNIKPVTRIIPNKKKNRKEKHKKKEYEYE